MTPLVSILTPSFNKPEYVAEAINSVLKQTFTDFEYWLIDNSTDTVTRPLLRRLTQKDPRLKYLEHDFSPRTGATLYPRLYLQPIFIQRHHQILFSTFPMMICLYPQCLARPLLILWKLAPSIPKYVTFL